MDEKLRAQPITNWYVTESVLVIDTSNDLFSGAILMWFMKCAYLTLIDHGKSSRSQLYQCQWCTCVGIQVAHVYLL